VLVLDCVDQSLRLLRGYIIVYPTGKRDETFQLSFLLVNQVSLDETYTLGDQEVWNSKLVELPDQLSPLDLVNLFTHSSHIHLHVLIYHAKVIDTVCEYRW